MIARKIAVGIENGSMIRRMFEEGNRLKAQYGADQVFDFSLGNPDLEPPAEVQTALRQLIDRAEPGLHRYMPNAGHADVRAAVASRYQADSGLTVDSSLVCMTVGAAGALNATLKALLNPGDEVLVLAPFFFEYLSYIDNHGGVPVIVRSDESTLLPDLTAIEAAVTPRTRALIINTPNNPSGVLYPAATLIALDRLLTRIREAGGPRIIVLSDEPYAELVYDGLKAPSTLACIQDLIVCTSWSKSLSLPGERIGCTVVSPRLAEAQAVSAAIIYCNRILGYVNAPALFQRVIAQAIDAKIDLQRYESRRNLLIHVLRAAGFTIEPPQGALYLFPKTPLPDDREFAALCTRHRVLLVPGSGFFWPGHVRLCFAVSEQTIRGSAPAFRAIASACGLTPG